MQKLIIGVGILVVFLLIVGFLLPAQSRFIVTTEIDAPPATVFALVNSMRRRELWSNLSVTDPNARVMYSGPPRGTGATVTWDGAIIGSGTQTISESIPYEHVTSLINPGEPGEARSWFVLAGESGGTSVRRGFEHYYGLNIVGRYFGVFVTGVIRRDYQNDLENLKLAAESLPAADFSDLDIERMRVEPGRIAYVSSSSTPDPASVSEALGNAYAEVVRFIDVNGLDIAGPPLSIKRSFRGSEFRFDAGIPVRGITESTPRESGKARLGSTHGGIVIRTTHIGSYDSLNQTHRKIAAYLAALGIERNGDAWESYVNDAAETAESELLTYIYYPVREGT